MRWFWALFGLIQAPLRAKATAFLPKLTHMGVEVAGGEVVVNPDCAESGAAGKRRGRRNRGEDESDCCCSPHRSHRRRIPGRHVVSSAARNRWTPAGSGLPVAAGFATQVTHQIRPQVTPRTASAVALHVSRRLPVRLSRAASPALPPRTGYRFAVGQATQTGPEVAVELGPDEPFGVTPGTVPGTVPALTRRASV